MHATCSIATFKHRLRLHSFDRVESRTQKPGKDGRKDFVTALAPGKKNPVYQSYGASALELNVCSQAPALVQGK
ncbi:hypothetical protein [Microcoleus sp. N3A4]|uniref:hypothetical protein n=1 Tax=Microcoleus sp. N3A4 TaxID=3055379 RepID=UPI002FD74E99